MNTSVNGKRCEWSAEIWAKWRKVEKDIPLCGQRVPRVTDANYFTPRPFRSEWDRGDLKEGFTYADNFRRVLQVCINGFAPWMVEEPGKGGRPLVAGSAARKPRE